MVDLEAYFQRIGYTGPAAPTAETLRNLHRAHLYTVPFENLDIHLKRPISIAIDDVFNKLVTARRGGFCYEQNSLFATVLRQIGFQVDVLEALPDESSIPYDHMTLLVHLEERWLADVGFGENFVEPLQLDNPEPQHQFGKTYRVEHDGKLGKYFSESPDGWKREFFFDLSPRDVRDFQPGCTFHQTSDESIFTRKRVCSLATPEGRITVSGLKLIETINGERKERLLADETELMDVLRNQFGISLPAPLK